MKKCSLLAIALSLACCAAVAADTQANFAFEAESFAVDDASEVVAVTGMTVQLGNSTQLVADEANYRLGASPVPRSVELNSVYIRSGQQVAATAESAVFYPELGIMTTEAYHVSRATAASVRGHGQRKAADGRDFSGGRLMDLHTYTCRGGVLYDNDEPAGSSTCINIYGGGSHSLTCSEGGNQVKVVWSDQACPVE